MNRDYPLSSEGLNTVTVWDPLVRVCHWSLVATFFIAYFTGDELLAVHVWAGYVIGGIVILRVVWGFVGPKHARFTDFIFGPLKVWRYLVRLIRFRAERYIGHSPTGGAMVIALLIGLTVTVWSGLETYAIEKNAGPLAVSTVATGAEAITLSPASVAAASEEGDRNGSKPKVKGEGVWEEVHEVLANLMLFLVIIHILGVVLASVVHRENLTRAMITGRKSL